MRWWLVRATVVLLCAPFAYCATRRTVVARPAVTIVVVDERGAPVAGAEVVVHWWSYPHRRLHESFAMATGPDGQVTPNADERRETIHPFCMHGVPQHEHTICAGAPGKGWASAQLPDGAQTLTLTLRGGAYAGECASFDRASFGAPVRTDAGPPAAAR